MEIVIVSNLGGSPYATAGTASRDNKRIDLFGDELTEQGGSEEGGRSLLYDQHLIRLHI